MKNKTTVGGMILDETGSMDPIKKSTISAVNEYISSLKKQKGEFLFTLTKFNSEKIETPYVNKDIKKVEKLTEETYVPNFMTPLYDAVVDTVEKMVEMVKQDQKVVMVIMTDGEENSSVRHDEKCLKDLIKKLQGEGNWTFVFLGANQDSWQMASKMGIYAGNVMNWNSTDRGVKNAMYSLTASTTSFSAKGDSQTKNFFNNQNK